MAISVYNFNNVEIANSHICFARGDELTIEIPYSKWEVTGSDWITFSTVENLSSYAKVKATVSATTVNRVGTINVTASGSTYKICITQYAYDKLGSESFRLFAEERPYDCCLGNGAFVQLNSSSYCKITKWELTEHTSGRVCTGDTSTWKCRIPYYVFTPDENTSFSATVRVNTDTYKGSGWEYEFDVPVIFKEKYIESDLSDTHCWEDDFGVVIGNNQIGADGNLAIKTALFPIWKAMDEAGVYHQSITLKLTNIHSGDTTVSNITSDIGTADEIIEIKLPDNTTNSTKQWYCDVDVVVRYSLGSISSEDYTLQNSITSVYLGEQLPYAANCPENPNGTEDITFDFAFPVGGGEYILNCFNSGNWNVSTKPSFVDLNATSGSDDITLNVSADKNISTDSKSEQMVIQTPTREINVNVTQSPIVVSWSLSPTKFTNYGGSVFGTVNYNLKPDRIVTRRYSDDGFTYPSWTLNADNATTTFQVNSAGGIVDRSIELYLGLLYGNKEYNTSKITLYQSGTNYYVTPQSATIPETGGEVTFTVTSLYPLNYNEVTGGTLNVISDTELEVTCSLPENKGEARTHTAVLSSTLESGLLPITLPEITQEGMYLNVYAGDITSLPAKSGQLIVAVDSNIDWTVSADNCLVAFSNADDSWTESLSGSGHNGLFVKYDEWFTYSGPRTLALTFTSALGEKVFTVPQLNESPWITFDSSTNKLPHTGGTITFENYAAVTNCKEVTLSVSEGTVTPTVHNGKWGETTSMNLVWEIPETESARTVTITGTAVASDGTPVIGTFNVKQSAPYTFDVNTDTLRNIPINGGAVTKDYTTTAPTVELELTNIPDFITDFRYTQPVNGVGTFTITYDDNYLAKSRYSRPYLNAYCDGFLIGQERINDYQLGTGFWLPDIEQTISYEEQVIEVKIHNASCDLRESNLSLHQSVPGLTVVSYTPQTTHISTDFGILYVKVPHNPGETRTFTIKVDALNDEGVVFASDTGVKITQLEIPPVIYVDIEVDAGYNKVEVDHSLYGDWWVLSKVNWIKAETTDGSDPGVVTVIVGGNSSENPRVGYVHIYGETQTYIIKITQTAIDFSFDPDDKLIPICDPITYSEATDKLDYLVVDQEVNGLKYVGRAHKYPDSDEVVIELNDILSDTLRNNISFTNGLQEMDGYVKKFGVQNQETGGGSIIYSYKAWKKPKWVLLNDHISNEVDPRQYVFVNYLDAYDDLTLHKNGEQVGALGKICGCAYVIPRDEAVCGEEVWYDVKVAGEDVLAVQNFIYKSTDKNYALYYLNNYGGWDSLAIRGNITQTDNIQSQTYKNKTNGKVKYLNQITPTWSLNTDSMNDGSKMYHLLESTQVYLHNLETDEIIPVVITDTSCVYKTYSNQGNTRFYYTINVEASNYKIRK